MSLLFGSNLAAFKPFPVGFIQTRLPSGKLVSISILPDKDMHVHVPSCGPRYPIVLHLAWSLIYLVPLTYFTCPVAVDICTDTISAVSTLSILSTASSSLFLSLKGFREDV